MTQEQQDKEENIDNLSDLKNNEVSGHDKGDESLIEDDLPFEGLTKKVKKLNFIACKNNVIFEKFFGDRKVDFQTFITKKKKIHSEFYEWKTHGYSILEEYFPDIAKSIDKKYDYIMGLTLESFGEAKGVNTDPFRKSIFYYIELIYGYVHMDFDYKKMNALLHKDIKLAAKTIGSTPQNLNYGIIHKFPIEFQTYEICHIALLIMEAKFQIELMYGFLALQNAKE